VYPVDIQTRNRLAAEHVSALKRSMHEARPGGGTPRQRLGFWLVELGLRLACERPVPSQA
jgi:hypothetical protein